MDTSGQSDIDILLIGKVTVIDARVDILLSLMALNWDGVEALENSNVCEVVGISDLQYWLRVLEP